MQLCLILLAFVALAAAGHVGRGPHVTGGIGDGYIYPVRRSPGPHGHGHGHGHGRGHGRPRSSHGLHLHNPGPWRSHRSSFAHQPHPPLQARRRVHVQTYKFIFETAPTAPIAPSPVLHQAPVKTIRVIHVHGSPVPAPVPSAGWQ